MKSRSSVRNSSSSSIIDRLRGSLLVAHPQNPSDMLEHGVILVASVEAGLAVCIQLDTVYPGLMLDDICHRMDIPYTGSTQVYRGGNQGVQRVHVVHSADWAGMTTVRINPEISISNDISVLTALAVGEGPSRFRACAGHWLWPVSQLESQLRSGASSYRWISCAATEEAVFQADSDRQWRSCVDSYTRVQQDAWLQRFNLH